jgi:hypothetical protein
MGNIFISIQEYDKGESFFAKVKNLKRVYIEKKERTNKKKKKINKIFFYLEMKENFFNENFFFLKKFI